MADVLKRLVGPMLIPAAATTIYTAGTGITAALRNIHIASTTGSLVTFSLAVNAAAGTVASSLYYNYSVPPQGAFDWSGLLVLNPTDYISVLGTASVLTITISGVEAS